VSGLGPGRELELLRHHLKLGDEFLDVPQLTVIADAGTVAIVCGRHAVAGFHGQKSPLSKETESCRAGNSGGTYQE
jgi:hypothetical protein